jgi:hypothetical protein
MQICRGVNDQLFNELTFSQRQQLYLKQATETLVYLEEKSLILFSTIEMASAIILKYYQTKSFSAKDLLIYESIEKLFALKHQAETFDFGLLELVWNTKMKK